jgi:hypothetical protein
MVILRFHKSYVECRFLKEVCRVQILHCPYVLSTWYTFKVTPHPYSPQKGNYQSSTARRVWKKMSWYRFNFLPPLRAEENRRRPLVHYSLAEWSRALFFLSGPDHSSLTVRKLQLNSFASFFLPLSHLKITVDKDNLSVGDKEYFVVSYFPMACWYNISLTVWIFKSAIQLL